MEGSLVTYSALDIVPNYSKRFVYSVAEVNKMAVIRSFIFHKGYVYNQFITPVLTFDYLSKYKGYLFVIPPVHLLCSIGAFALCMRCINIVCFRIVRAYMLHFHSFRLRGAIASTCNEHAHME